MDGPSSNDNNDKKNKKVEVHKSPQQTSIAVISNQPRPGTPKRKQVIHNPVGLDVLKGLDLLILEQNREISEVISRYKAANKMEVRDRGERLLFYIFEESDEGARFCLGAARSFLMRGYDIYHNEVFNIKRDLQCTGCCSTHNDFEVFSPPGTLIGKVVQEKKMTFSIRDNTDSEMCKMKGQQRPCKVPVWDLMREDQKVGSMHKMNNYHLYFTFPKSLQNWQKILILGGWVFVKASFYDNPPGGYTHHR